MYFNYGNVQEDVERDGVCSTNNVEIVRDRQMYSKKS